MDKSIYLDYAATTPIDPRVVAKMIECMGPDGQFANPASTHSLGISAQALVEDARAAIAARIDALPGEIVFTSGATESNNLALKGVLLGPTARRGRLLTTRIEHKAVLDTAKVIASHGIPLDFLPTDKNGRVELAALRTELAKGDVAIVSVMHVNNETGTFHDVDAIAALCREHDALFHTDAAQSIGKRPLAVMNSGIDLCSLTAHKICGPKGIGALYVRSGTRLSSQMHGGDQEHGLRAGTLATHQIVGMGESYSLADPVVDGPRMAALCQRLLAGLAQIDGAVRNVEDAVAIPNIVNMCFPGVSGESLRLALDGIAVSAGSACNSAVPEPSYVLRSLGLSDMRADASLRISFGRFTTVAEIDAAVARIQAAVSGLRRVSAQAPAWCSA